MSDLEFDAKQAGKRGYDLAQAMDRVKSAQADRDDVVVEMKQATRARLELLARDLQPLLNQIPEDVEWIEFGISKGDPPRLWIDVTTHVRMGRDRRVYELVKDTRLGRTILARSQHKEQMAEHVADYIAERILEHNKAREGDWLSLKNLSDEVKPTDRKVPKNPRKWPTGIRSFIWFMAGIMVTAFLMLIWAWIGEFRPF